MEKKDIPQEKVQETIKNATRYLQENKPFLEAISKDWGIRFKIGERPASSFQPETGVIELGWAYFLEKRAGAFTAVSALFHELGHLRHLISNPDQVTNTYKSVEKPEMCGLLNACDDIEIEEYLKHYPPVRKEREQTYRDADSLRQPSPSLSTQFLSGLMSYAMFGRLSPGMDSTVKQSLESLRDVKGVDAIELLKTTPEPQLRYPLINSVFKPVFEKFLEKDRASNKETLDEMSKMLSQLSGEDAEEISKKLQGGETPLNLTKEELEKIISFVKGKQKEMGKKEKASVSETAAGVTAAEQNIDVNEAADYREDFDEIKPYVNSVADALDKIADEHILYTFGLSAPSTRGVIIEPGLLHQAYASIKAGQQPSVFRKVEAVRKTKRLFPTDVTFHLLADMSFSMEGEKEDCQRKTAVLLMEGLNEYQERLERKRTKLGLPGAGFNVYSSIRRFGSQDVSLKEASQPLTPGAKISVHRNLFFANEGSTREDLSLQRILDKLESMPDKEKERLRKGEIKHIVIVMSDGASGNPEETKRITERLRNLGTEVWGLGITEDAKDILDLLSPNSILVEAPNKLSGVLSRLITERIRGKQEGKPEGKG